MTPAEAGPYYLPTGNEVGIAEQCHAGGLAMMLAWLLLAWAGLRMRAAQ